MGSRVREYHDPSYVARFPQAEADNLVERLRHTLALAAVVHENFRQIRGESLSIGVEWSSTVESLLAHMEIDLSWLQKEFKQIGG
jgi:hypothetical protein